ncbi:hypothetical protein NCC49_003571 [Naganishia albida]|nr:hypothetical protein NCC49_003571 [Naganishia albida]
MMRTSNQRVQGMRSTKPKTKPVEAMSYEELQQALQRNLAVLSNSSLFATSSTQPFRSDPLATRLTQMNERIRARIEQLDEKTIANMANDLEATRITDEIKGMPINGTRRSSQTRHDTPARTSISNQGQIIPGPDSQPNDNSLDPDTSFSFNSGKRRAEDQLHQRHGKVEAGGKAKVFHVSAEESLSLQKSPTKQPSTNHFESSENQSNANNNAETRDDPMEGRKGHNVHMSYGRKEPFDELSHIAQAAKLKSFISYVPWDSDDDSDSDDELENAILYGDLDAIARAREKAEVLEEVETASESGSIADGMDMSGIIAVDVDRIQENEDKASPTMQQ